MFPRWVFSIDCRSLCVVNVYAICKYLDPPYRLRSRYERSSTPMPLLHPFRLSLSIVFAAKVSLNWAKILILFQVGQHMEEHMPLLCYSSHLGGMNVSSILTICATEEGRRRVNFEGKPGGATEWALSGYACMSLDPRAEQTGAKKCIGSKGEREREREREHWDSPPP